MLSNAPHGAEHVSGTLSGEALGWVTWKDIAIMAPLFAIVGAFLYLNRKKLQLCSEDPKKARAMGLSVKKWDFLFYAAFGLVVTSSVKVSGVLAVFSYLIVPVVCSTLLGRKGRARLYWAWVIAFVVSILGAVLSYLKDWPMGATIVCLFGVTVADRLALGAHEVRGRGQCEARRGGGAGGDRVGAGGSARGDPHPPHGITGARASSA